MQINSNNNNMTFSPNVWYEIYKILVNSCIQKVFNDLCKYVL